MLRYQQNMHLVQPTEAPLKIAPANRAIIGSLAPHGMKVVVMMVIRLSRSFSMVLEAMTPGTPHPVPISIGMKDLPERPNLRKIRSMINATRAIYPQSSRIARKMNRISIWGTKPSTAPTPATIPSRIKLCSHPAQPTLVRNPLLQEVRSRQTAHHWSSQLRKYLPSLQTHNIPAT